MNLTVPHPSGLIPPGYRPARLRYRVFTPFQPTLSHHPVRAYGSFNGLHLGNLLAAIVSLKPHSLMPLVVLCCLVKALIEATDREAPHYPTAFLVAQ